MALSHLSDLVGRVVADRYRIVSPLATGASGRVYLADDTQLRRRVALKVLHEGMADDAAFLKRFRAEARAAAALNHPNVMHVYDSGADGGLPYLVCEYLGGGSLKAVLDAGHRLSVGQALLVGLDAARGLDYAHRQGLIHRDIKPANLLFGEEGRLRIGDFGLARAIAEAAWTEPEGMLLGTARYAAPEQAQGRSLDGTADVYALALVLIEAVTGRVPFSADTTMATLMARCEGDLVVPEELSRLREPLARAGRLDPATRSDARQLEVALMAAAEEMERPAAIPLAGALPLLDGTPSVDLTDGHRADVSWDDVTMVVPAGGGLAVVEAASTTTSAPTGGGIDIPLDSDPAPLVAVTPPEVRPGGDDEAPGGAGPGRRWPRRLGIGLVLALLATGGLMAWLLLRTPSYEVPDLVGDDLAGAQELADRNGWTLSTELARRDGTAPDEILSQAIAPGERLARGEDLELEVSLGPTLVGLPEVVLRPLEEAEAALAAAELAVGTLTPAAHEDIPSGSVVESRAPVDAEGRVPKGTPVDLTVSIGPAPRTVPGDLVGGGVSAAREALEGLRLEVATASRFSDQPKGIVLATDPPAGTEVPRDSTVTLTVSAGPAPVPIPAVVGASVAEATSALQAQGFVVTGVEGSPTGTVLATDPPAGEPHQRGTGVRLFTRA